MSAQIRPALPGDLAAIVETEAAGDTAEWLGETGPAWHQAAFADPCQRHLVAVDDGAVVGFAVVAWTDHHGPTQLRRLVVGPPARGRGCGRALLRASVRAARENDQGRVVWIDVQRSNRRAIRLCESSGFVAGVTAPPTPDAAGAPTADRVVMRHSPGPV